MTQSPLGPGPRLRLANCQGERESDEALERRIAELDEYRKSHWINAAREEMAAQSGFAPTREQMEAAIDSLGDPPIRPCVQLVLAIGIVVAAGPWLVGMQVPFEIVSAAIWRVW